MKSKRRRMPLNQTMTLREKLKQPRRLLKRLRNRPRRQRQRAPRRKPRRAWICLLRRRSSRMPIQRSLLKNNSKMMLLKINKKSQQQCQKAQFKSSQNQSRQLLKVHKTNKKRCF
jgi:hypothetical protein